LSARGGDDRVQTRAVGELGIDHWRDFVDTPTRSTHQSLDEVQQMVVAGELHVGLFELAVPLDVYVPRAVDEDVADVLVVHQFLQRAEAVNFVEDVLHHRLPLIRGQGHRFARAEMRGQRFQLLAELRFREFARLGQVDGVDHLPMNAGLQLLKGLPGIQTVSRRQRCGNHGRASYVRVERLMAEGRNASGDQLRKRIVL